VALLLAVLAFTAYLVGSGEVWRRLMGVLGHSLRASARTGSGSLPAGRYVPTALLLPMLRMAMAEREGVPKRVTAASVAYELASSSPQA
jgi:hypothetical protein